MDAGVIAAVQSRVDELGNGRPRRAAHTVAELGVGDAHIAEAGAQALECLIECGDVDALAGGARVDDGGMDGNKGVAVGARLARAEANGTQVGRPADDRDDDDVALAGASPVAQVGLDLLHGRHRGRAEVGMRAGMG